jgi:hypothetical protein
MDYPPPVRLKHVSALSGSGKTPRKAIKSLLKSAKQAGLSGGGLGCIAIIYVDVHNYEAVWFMEDV